MSRAANFAKSLLHLKMPPLPKDHLTRTLLQAADRGNFAAYQEAISPLSIHEKQVAVAKFDYYPLKAFAFRGNEEASLTLFYFLNDTSREQIRYWLINELAKKGKFDAVYDMFFPFDNAKNAHIVEFENYRLLDHAASHNNEKAAEYYLKFLTGKQIKDALSKNGYKVLTTFAKHDNFEAVSSMLEELSDKDSENAVKASKIIKIFAQNGNFDAVDDLLQYLSDADRVKALLSDDYLIIKSCAEKLDIDALTLLYLYLSEIQRENALLSGDSVTFDYFIEAGYFEECLKLLGYLSKEEQKNQLMKDNCYMLRMMAKNDSYSEFFGAILILDLSEKVGIFEAKEYSIIRNFAVNNNYPALDRIFSMMGDNINVSEILSAKNYAIIRNFALAENTLAVSELIAKLKGIEKMAASEILGQYDLPQITYPSEEVILVGADAVADAA